MSPGNIISGISGVESCPALKSASCGNYCNTLGGITSATRCTVYYILECSMYDVYISTSMCTYHMYGYSTINSVPGLQVGLASPGDTCAI